MADIPNITINNYHLSADQLYILGATSYLGHFPMEMAKLKKMMEAQEMNSKSIETLWGQLYDHGLVENRRIERWGTAICKGFHLAICTLIIQNYPYWEYDYQRFRDYRSDTSSDLWELAKALVKGDKKKAIKIIDQPTYSLTPLINRILPLVEIEEAWELLLGVREESFYRIMDAYIDDKVWSDTFRDQESHYCHYLCQVYEAKKKKRPLASKLAYLDYLMMAKPIPEGLERDEYSLAAKAIAMMYQDRYEDALAAFAQSFKYYNTHSSEKNYYQNPILCFWLVVCYIKCDTTDSRKKLQQMLNKKGFQENIDLRPMKLLAEYALRGDPNGQEIRQSTFRDMSPLTQLLVRLWLAITKTDSKKMKLDNNDLKRVPNCAIIRYELTAFGQETESNNTIWADCFGPHTIMDGLKFKEQWEMVLEDMHALLSKESSGQDNVQDKRIVYYCNESMSQVTMKEQRRLKSGAWSVGTDVAFSAFCNGSIASMTDCDRKVASVVSHECEYSYDIDPTHVLPYMVGEDRVFRSTRSGYTLMTITEEPPFLTIEPRDTVLEIGANVEFDKYYNKVQPINIRLVDDSHALVVRVTAQQSALLAKLLSLGSLPKDASSRIKPLLELLAKHIEVHSSLIDGGSTLSQIQGQTTIILRMEPQKEAFFVQPQVEPLKDGMLREIPGQGKKVVYDEVNGVRYQVTRNLKAERQNYDRLAEEGGLYLDVEGSLLELEEMLDLLEFVQDDPLYEMEWLEGTKYKVRKVNPNKEVNVGLVAKQNWFDIEGEVELEEGQVLSSADFLRLMSEGLVGRRFVRLNDGEYVALTEQLTKQLQQLSILAQYDRKGAHIPRYQVGAIAEALERNGNVVKTDKGFEQLKKKIRAAAKMKIAVPEQLKAELRDYQEEGFRWMVRLTEWGAGACLADDMGLGKTVQTIALMLYRAKKGAMLVVCPASVIYNWKAELERFAPSLAVTLLSEVEDRKSVISQAQKHSVVLTTYGLLVREAELLRQKEWNLLVLDEAHTIKNRSTKMSAAAMDLQAQARVILTGTPVQNDLSELWNLFQFLNPGLLGTFEHFTNRYILPIERDENKATQSQLKHAIQPFLLRRTKAEVVEELPDKTEITHLVELSEEERMAYEALRISAQEKMAEEKKMGVNVLSMITRLREAACSMSLVSNEWVGGSSKIEAFKELVDQIVMGGNRVLVFSQFTGFLAQVREALDSMNGMKYLYLDGSTPTRRRAEMVRQFQHGDVPVFLISLKAGGLGLNLTGANYVIHLDPWWNPAIEQQATDRAYRIGQHQNVTVYHLVSDHTIEQKILRLHKTKRDMADALLEGTNLGRAMTLEDLKYLVETE